MAEFYSGHLNEHLTMFEEEFPRFHPIGGELQDTVVAAMKYACEAGGKRIRPVLLLEFSRLCGCDPEKAMPFAAAIEMIHSYSLVHDDLPCMDNSPLRRGRPSTHAVYGETMALLAGDGLLTRAFEIILAPTVRGSLPNSAVRGAASALAFAAGSDGMVGGQVIDCENENKVLSLEALKTLHRLKTGALLTAACVMGARLGEASADMEAAARKFGENFGLCFQIVDDILDVTATAEKLGKPVGNDADHHKNTFVSLLGLEPAQDWADRCTDSALAALDVFGDEANDLRQLTVAMLKRDH